MKQTLPYQRAHEIEPFITEFLSAGAYASWQRLKGFRATMASIERRVANYEEAMRRIKGKALYTRDPGDQWTEACYYELYGVNKILEEGLNKSIQHAKHGRKQMAKLMTTEAETFYSELYRHLALKGYPSTKTTREAVRFHLFR